MPPGAALTGGFLTRCPPFLEPGVSGEKQPRSVCWAPGSCAGVGVTAVPPAAEALRGRTGTLRRSRGSRWAKGRRFSLPGVWGVWQHIRELLLLWSVLAVVSRIVQ